MPEIRYGSRVLIRDRSKLDGCAGVVIKLLEDGTAHVLVDKEVIWPVKPGELEPVA